MINVAIRVDGHDEIGRGHLSRCLALAKEFKKKGTVVDFFIWKDDRAISFIKEQGFNVTRLANKVCSEELLNSFSNNKFDIFISDIDILDKKYFENIRTEVYYLVQLDIHRDLTLPVDLLINGGIYAPVLQEEAKKNKLNVLLGAEFNLLREEFRHTADKLVNSRVKHVLISLGASDVHKLSKKVMNAVLSISPDIHVHLVIGSDSHPLLHEQLDLSRVTLHEMIKDIKSLMTMADIAITSGGVTLYELSAIGTPSYVIIQAENQKLQTKTFFDQKAIIGYQSAETFSEAIMVQDIKKVLSNVEARQQISYKMRKIVDGKGSQRVADYILYDYNLKK